MQPAHQNAPQEIVNIVRKSIRTVTSTHLTDMFRTDPTGEFPADLQIEIAGYSSIHWGKRDGAHYPSELALVSPIWAQAIQPIYYDYCNLGSCKYTDSFLGFWTSITSPCLPILSPGRHIRGLVLTQESIEPHWPLFLEAIPHMTVLEDLAINYFFRDRLFHRLSEHATKFTHRLKTIALFLHDQGPQEVGHLTFNISSISDQRVEYQQFAQI